MQATKRTPETGSLGHAGTRPMRDGLTRRHFLAGLAAFGLGSAIVPKAFATPGTCQQTALFMGTFVRVDVAGESRMKAEEAVNRALEKGRELERILTRFDASSPLGILNGQGALSDMPRELALMLEESARVFRLTDGGFDPSVLPLVRAMQADPQKGRNLGSREMHDLLALVDYGRVRVSAAGARLGQGQALTLDGIAKGYIAREMSAELARLGCPNHLVNAGGDIVASGHPQGARAWRVAIQSPFDQGRAGSVVHLSKGSIATSGAYGQRLDNASGSHLLIPKTLNVPDVISASVACGDGMLADALATAFSILPPASSMRLVQGLDKVEAMLVLRNGRVLRSGGWPA